MPFLYHGVLLAERSRRVRLPKATSSSRTSVHPARRAFCFTGNPEGVSRKAKKAPEGAVSILRLLAVIARLARAAAIPQSGAPPYSATANVICDKGITASGNNKGRARLYTPY